MEKTRLCHTTRVLYKSILGSGTNLILIFQMSNADKFPKKCTSSRFHHHQPEHVSACLGSAALRGGYDDDSILRLTGDDRSSDHRTRTQSQRHICSTS
jgi:hypothetical protein